MAHLLSIFFFISLFAGLAMVLHRSLWDNRSAIRAALLGVGRTEDVQRPETEFERVGTCLRASFPPIAGALNDEMDRLLARLSQKASYPAPQPAMA